MVIGPGAVVGDDCVVHAHVSIRERVQIGHRVILQDGAVIGSDGFGFVKLADGTHVKIPQHADVVIEDDVEIGANTTIDRPAVGETRISAGTKIDNLVQIAHGVTVGRRVLFAAQVGIAGSTVVEDDVVLAGQVGVAGHLRIGKGVVATAQTGVPNSVDAGEVISGYPAIPNRDWLKSSAVFRQLPSLKKRVADLEQRIAELRRSSRHAGFLPIVSPVRGDRRVPRLHSCSLPPLSSRWAFERRRRARSSFHASTSTWRPTRWGPPIRGLRWTPIGPATSTWWTTCADAISFLADYQALIGNEFRAFDPYQSSYTLEAMSSVRKGRTEFVGVLNHVSRHFGDRFNVVAVAENSLEAARVASFQRTGHQHRFAWRCAEDHRARLRGLLLDQQSGHHRQPARGRGGWVSIAARLRS